jgi:hypothetical protein
VDVWTYGLKAFQERPLFGWGLGNHGYAVRPYFTEQFTRASAWDDVFMSWEDPHNIVAMLLVTTGLAGSLAATWFVATHFRRGVNLAYLGAFIGCVMGWMLQPATVHSLPVAFLMLGAAIGAPQGRPISPRSGLAGALVVTGALLSTALVVPNAIETHALRQRDLGLADVALQWNLDDVVFAGEIARLYTERAVDDPSYRVVAIDKAALPVEIDPTRPLLWAQYARRLMELEQYEKVPAALDRAFALERWNPSAWEAKLAYAVAIKDYDLADETREVVCRLDLAMCATGSRFPIDLDLAD